MEAKRLCIELQQLDTVVLSKDILTYLCSYLIDDVKSFTSFGLTCKRFHLIVQEYLTANEYSIRRNLLTLTIRANDWTTFCYLLHIFHNKNHRCFLFEEILEEGAHVLLENVLKNEFYHHNLSIYTIQSHLPLIFQKTKLPLIRVLLRHPIFRLNNQKATYLETLCEMWMQNCKENKEFLLLFLEESFALTALYKATGDHYDIPFLRKLYDHALCPFKARIELKMKILFKCIEEHREAELADLLDDPTVDVFWNSANMLLFASMFENTTVLDMLLYHPRFDVTPLEQVYDELITRCIDNARIKSFKHLIQHEKLTHNVPQLNQLMTASIISAVNNTTNKEILDYLKEYFPDYLNTISPDGIVIDEDFINFLISQ